MPEPEIRPSTLLLIVGTIQAVFLVALTLFYRSRLIGKSKRYAAAILALLFGLFGYTLFDHFLEATNYFVFVPFLIYVTVPLDMLIGPSLLGLVSAETNPQAFRFKRSHLIHLIPAVVVFLALIPIYTLAPDLKLELLHNGLNLDVSDSSIIIRLLARLLVVLTLIPYLELSLFGYLAAITILIWRRRDVFGDPEQAMTGIKKSWLIGLLGLFFVQTLLLSAHEPLQSLLRIDNTTYFNILLSSVTILIFLISFVAFSLISPSRAGTPVLAEPVKYQNSGLDPSQAEIIGRKITTLMQEGQLYRDPALKLPVLAGKLGYSSNIISQVINTQFGKSYSDFVNQYRIDAAKSELSKPDSDALILTIANEVGFNTKATFNAAFKKFVGTTPSQYRKAQREA